MILLGLGFTACHLAKRLLARGMTVHGVARQPERFESLRSVGLRVAGFESGQLPKRATVVHSIPPGAPGIREFIDSLEPDRVIYISSTTVYGDQTEVDETTRPDPRGDTALARFEEERWLGNRGWRTLIVRPAAIYGPGRGVHQKIREGKLPRGAGRVVSRIHVDDLAAVLEAGILSDVAGAWPLADDRPCSSDEISEFCLRLMRLPPNLPAERIIPIPGRNVDGRRIRDLLGVSLAYATYESGIIASVAQIATILI